MTRQWYSQHLLKEDPTYGHVDGQTRDKWIFQPRKNDEGGFHVQEQLLLPLTRIQRHISFPNFSPTIFGEYLFIFTQA
jgi:hypothetical protein